MRLGQLARQLEVKPEKIVSFLLKKKDITIKEHPNSKVEDDLIEVITTHFQPVAEEPEVTEETEKVVAKEVVVEEQVEEVVEEQKEPEHIETAKPEAAQELKIIGKIDLPNKAEINVEVDGVVYDQETLDKKKKEELKEEREKKAIEKEEKRKEDEERKAKAREQRLIEQERQAMLETEKHNILTKEEERKKEIILKAQKDREDKLEAARKAKQKEHYNQQFSATAATKKKKKVTAKAAEPQAETVEITESTSKEAPVVEAREKSAFKRFVKWLNT